MQSRLNIAIDFLKEGQSFNVDDIRLGITQSGDIEVTGWSQYSNPEYLTKTIALKELNEIKSLFSEMLKSSSELREFVREKSVHFYLHFDDSGKTSIAICNEIHDVVTWSIALK